MSTRTPPELHSWMCLLRTPGIGPANLRRLLERHSDASTALSALRHDAARLGLDPATRTWLDEPDEARIQADLDWLDGEDHHFIACTDARFPALLREIPSAPAGLFIAGDASLLWLPQVAIVGSRGASANGLAITERFAKALCRAGFAITSGMADGVDGRAHQAALACGGKTLAVLGTGPDQVYPRKHGPLAAEIRQRGALVSEFPPGTLARPEHFPRRNRIIAGLALGTLVVEAGLKSGSLITARQATEQGREVFAIPGSINNPLTRGSHQLIREGARLTETADEIIEALSPMAQALGAELRQLLASDAESASRVGPAHPAHDADPDYARLLAAMGTDEVDIDQLAERSGLAVAALSSMLLMLELDGAVVARGGRYQRLFPG